MARLLARLPAAFERRALKKSLPAMNATAISADTTAGVGFLAPVGSNASEAGRALNRRVELVAP